MTHLLGIFQRILAWKRVSTEGEGSESEVGLTVCMTDKERPEMQIVSRTDRVVCDDRGAYPVAAQLGSPAFSTRKGALSRCSSVGWPPIVGGHGGFRERMSDGEVIRG